MTITDEKMLKRFGCFGVCSWCGAAGKMDPAHVHARGRDNGHRLDIAVNLVSLCRLCHSRSHAGGEPEADDLLAVVAFRERTTVDAICAAVWWFDRADKAWEWQPELLAEKVALIEDAETRRLVTLALDERTK